MSFKNLLLGAAAAVAFSVMGTGVPVLSVEAANSIDRCAAIDSDIQSESPDVTGAVSVVADGNFATACIGGRNDYASHSGRCHQQHS